MPSCLVWTQEACKWQGNEAQRVTSGSWQCTHHQSGFQEGCPCLAINVRQGQAGLSSIMANKARKSRSACLSIQKSSLTKATTLGTSAAQFEPQVMGCAGPVQVTTSESPCANSWRTSWAEGSLTGRDGQATIKDEEAAVPFVASQLVKVALDAPLQGIQLLKALLSKVRGVDVAANAASAVHHDGCVLCNTLQMGRQSTCSTLLFCWRLVELILQVRPRSDACIQMNSLPNNTAAVLQTLALLQSSLDPGC